MTYIIFGIASETKEHGYLTRMIGGSPCKQVPSETEGIIKFWNDSKALEPIITDELHQAILNKLNTFKYEKYKGFTYTTSDRKTIVIFRHGSSNELPISAKRDYSHVMNFFVEQLEYIYSIEHVLRTALKDPIVKVIPDIPRSLSHLTLFAKNLDFRGHQLEEECKQLVVKNG